jgi:arabinogalactan oligomer/maltooligosaccharide transport system substrate-binding protein
MLVLTATNAVKIKIFKKRKENKMKKILALLLAVLMIVGLTACGKKDDGGAAATGEKISITVWTPTEDQAEGNSWLNEVITKFKAAHPDYNIEIIPAVMDEGSAAGSITTDVSAGADVYMFANDQLGGLIAAGGLSKLGGDFEAQVKNDNPQFHIDSVTHTDGAVYAFPMTNNTWFTYYNKDVYSADDVKSLDTMLSKGKVCVPFNVGWNSGCFFLGTGCSVFGPAGNDVSKGIDFGGDKAYTAAKKMLEVAANPNCVPGGMDTGLLMSGEVAAVFSGSWSRGELEKALGDKLGVAKLPTFEADGKTYNMTALSGSKAVGVNPHTANPAAATQFAAFLASVDSQKSRFEMRGVIPAASVLAEDEAIKSNIVAVAEINTMANTSVAQSAIPEMGNYWTPVGNFGGLCASGAINADNYKEQVDQMMEALNSTGL